MNALLQAFFARLAHFSPLSEEEKHAFINATSGVKRFPPREALMREGEPPDGARVVIDGFACRYKMLKVGRRQIVGYLMPGDLCDLRVSLLKRMDHSVTTLTQVDAAIIPLSSLLELMERCPRITRALWWSTLVDEAIAREWIVNVGQRTAFERLAHLFCELHARLQAVGLTQGDRCDLPLTQTEIADSLALSAVHMNRTLMEMRRMGLVTFHNRELVIHDLRALQEAAGFNPGYLHLDPP